MSHHLDLALLAGAAVVLVSVSAVGLSRRLGLPSLLVYLGIGLALGESGLGLQFSDADEARLLGTAALVVILAEGGLTSRWSDLRDVLPLSMVLSTVGVLITVGIVAVAAQEFLDVEWRIALLYGAVVASTDAAAVFSTLRTIALPRRVAATLEAESGSNDAVVVIAVLLLTSSDWGHTSVWHSLGLVVYELSAGAGIGVGVGFLGVLFLRRVALPTSGLYPLATVAFAVLAYAGAAVLHASGFLAIYLAGVVLGNSDLPHKAATRGFVEGLAWLAQIGVFVMLGLLDSPSRLPSAVVPALIIGFVLLLVARPVAVLACATPFRIPLREQAFMSWAGLRGAVPVVLATVPLSQDLPGATRLFDVVFLLVAVFTLIQGPSLAPLARVLRIVQPQRLTALDIEAAPLERVHADLLTFTVPHRSRMNSVLVRELRLPELGAQLSLVVRDGRTVVPDPDFRLRIDDQLLLVVAPDCHEVTEQRLQDVNRLGRAAPWQGQRG